MKALIQSKYGGPEVLNIQEVPVPIVKPDEVLVKIHAAAVNDYDWSLMRGKPWLYRLMFGLFKPKSNIPGMELAGIVELIGENVTKYKVGQSVFGDISEYGFGAFSEYVAINENAIFLKPDFLSFTEAAGLSHAAMLAWQGLVQLGELESLATFKKTQNKKVHILVNGAGGGMGMYALIIAKHYNAEVTGVDATEKLPGLLKLGFDYVIDYTKQDVTKISKKFDLIIDAKTKRSPFSFLKILAKNTTFITVGGDLPRLVQIFFVSKYIKKIHHKQVKILALKANQGLEEFYEILKNSTIKPIIDGPHSFEKTNEMIQFFGEGKHCGKIIIDIAGSKLHEKGGA
ncbi:NAD(P)-dependent alcohol dehydrogenase [Marinicellulosiphila megalodicopiae]|uniref:NAD(P)-dependent alcohol dehydrogenase n=1 Tax=Marinicellulosiphila megalodicopiae TaxID=2724896 RepID=UPI003BB0E845